jgi:hypothetical protein
MRFVEDPITPLVIPSGNYETPTVGASYALEIVHDFTLRFVIKVIPNEDLAPVKYLITKLLVYDEPVAIAFLLPVFARSSSPAGSPPRFLAIRGDLA